MLISTISSWNWYVEWSNRLENHIQVGLAYADPANDQAIIDGLNLDAEIRMHAAIADFGALRNGRRRFWDFNIWDIGDKSTAFTKFTLQVNVTTHHLDES